MKTIEMASALAMVREADGMTSDERGALVNERLRELVAYARANSPYFKRLYSGAGENFSLLDLPATQKSGLQENFDDWTTDREVNASELRRHMEKCAQAALPTPYLDKYSYVSTSGTTGEPFIMLRDDYHNKIHAALINGRLMNAVGADIFSPAKNRIASVIITNPSVSSYGSFLRAKNAMPQYSDNMLALSTTQPVEAMVATLNAYQPTAVTGYPSVLAILAEEQLSGRLNIRLKAIACSAEPLTPAAYAVMREAFGCPVLNNYCMTEGGEVAFSNGLCDRLHLNEDWIIVEPIDAAGNPARPGEYSDAILVTDLSNYICPIIRYRMTDRVMISRGGACACGSSLPELKISGRELITLTLGGKRLTGDVVDSALEKTQGVLKCQVALVGPDALEIRLKAGGEATFAQTSRRVEEVMRQILDKMGCCGVSISVVDKNPVNDKRTGKCQPIVNEVR